MTISRNLSFLAEGASATGVLATTNGGTGTATTFTTGSVPFAGASGVYSQDNTKLFWDNTNKRFGVGSASPDAALFVLGVTAGTGASSLRIGYNSTSVNYIDGDTTYIRKGDGTALATLNSSGLTLGIALTGANGGTGLTSFTANGLVYASSTSALATSSSLTYSSSRLCVGGTLTANTTPTMQVGNSSSIVGDGVTYGWSTALTQNAYQTGNNAWAYTTTGAASALYRQSDNTHAWYVAPSGTAGGAISFTQAMQIGTAGGVSIGNTTDKGASTLNVSGLIYPQQATTAAAPAYAKGAIYFDTTLNKLRVGGATAWETITSV